MPASKKKLINTASNYFLLPPNCGLVLANGTQAFIQTLPALVPHSRVGILDFTYGEHAICWKRFGHRVEIVSHLEALATFDIAIVVNPNNPDGRVVPPDQLHGLAEKLLSQSGMLIVDEAFCDVMPEVSVIPNLEADNVIVLRSFGKFFGLAGIRLGFAIGYAPLLQCLNAQLGPWCVSGPAQTIGALAMSDTKWIQHTKEKLSKMSARQQGVFEKIGLEVIGRTNLFLLVRHHRIEYLYEKLCEQHILVRKFEERPHWLRIGICADNQPLQRQPLQRQPLQRQPLQRLESGFNTAMASLRTL